MDPITEEELNLLNYFWQKGDVERWTDWYSLSSRRPDIDEAWGNYKSTVQAAKSSFEAKLDMLSYEIES